MPNVKLCECGCGKPAAIASKTNVAKGHVKGEPMRFARCHVPRETRAKIAASQKGVPRKPEFVLSGERHWNWKTGRTITQHGYVHLTVGADHPMADKRGRVLEHRLVMAEAIGRPLRKREVVHHINGIRDDNRIANLRLFSSNAEHRQFHADETRELREEVARLRDELDALRGFAGSRRTCAQHDLMTDQWEAARAAVGYPSQAELDEWNREAARSGALHGHRVDGDHA